MSLEEQIQGLTAAVKELTATIQGGNSVGSTGKAQATAPEETKTAAANTKARDDTREEEQRSRLRTAFIAWLDADKASASSWLRGFTGVKKGPVKIQQIAANKVSKAIEAVERELAILNTASGSGDDDDLV